MELQLNQPTTVHTVSQLMKTIKSIFLFLGLVIIGLAVYQAYTANADLRHRAKVAEAKIAEFEKQQENAAILVSSALKNEEFLAKRSVKDAIIWASSLMNVEEKVHEEVLPSHPPRLRLKEYENNGAISTKPLICTYPGELGTTFAIVVATEVSGPGSLKTLHPTFAFYQGVQGANAKRFTSFTEQVTTEQFIVGEDGKGTWVPSPEEVKDSTIQQSAFLAFMYNIGK